MYGEQVTKVKQLRELKCSDSSHRSKHSRTTRPNDLYRNSLLSHVNPLSTLHPQASGPELPVRWWDFFSLSRRWWIHTGRTPCNLKCTRRNGYHLQIAKHYSVLKKCIWGSFFQKGNSRDKELKVVCIVRSNQQARTREGSLQYSTQLKEKYEMFLNKADACVTVRLLRLLDVGQKELESRQNAVESQDTNKYVSRVSKLSPRCQVQTDGS